ncbi:serine-rich adhesin for platelets [Eurosta solidaginis]|uniref:serine-rich adhesin for platelets n=1 Tax=Eurosta solidaginis TaxID=178769 RepID=UPI0035309BFC
MSETSNMEQPNNRCEAHLLAATTEIQALKQALLEKHNQIVAMETACMQDTERQIELEDSVIAWQDKYDRLYESHKRVQKVNQSLEDKLLKMVDRNTGERAQLTSDVATLSVRLAQANFNIAKLQREIERYKSDINLAIQLLQCKPDSFMPQKVSSLPTDIQAKVSAYMRLETNSHSDSEGSTSGVGTATTASYKVLPASDSPPPTACPFPPTAMVYSMRGLDGKLTSTDSNMNLSNNSNNNNNGNNDNSDIKEPLLNNGIIINNNNSNNTSSNKNNNSETSTALNTELITNNNINNSNNAITSNLTSFNGNDTTTTTNDPNMISPIIMAKFLEGELKASEVKHCNTCQCSKQDLTVLADVARSYTVSTQTPYQLSSIGGNLNEPLTQLCLRCHSNLNSPSRTNSPYLMKLVKSSDSVISETKSSVSDLNDMDKLFTPAKKDDLMVNPILGHHRLCERTAGSNAIQHQNGGINGAGKVGNTTLLYPATHLSSYGMEKYMTNSSTLVAQAKAGFQRRFMDGGGTALELLNATTTSGFGGITKKPVDDVTQQSLVNDELDDEAKPLLSGVSHSSLLDYDRLKVSAGLELTESALEQQTKSPASVCSVTDEKQNLLKSTITGSVNSLWSRTSSCEGAKMFETFNRNLIKTIKAENPKHRGPRLCAMRIQQNGQSNILLDNIESMEAVTPIIYKRRERLLDEELDDTKDIITSPASNSGNAAHIAAVGIAERSHLGGEEKLIDGLISIQMDSVENNAGLEEERIENEQNYERMDNVVLKNCVDNNGTREADSLNGCVGGEVSKENENSTVNLVPTEQAAELIDLLETNNTAAESRNGDMHLASDSATIGMENNFDRQTVSNQKMSVKQQTSTPDLALTQTGTTTAVATTNSTTSNKMRSETRENVAPSMQHTQKMKLATSNHNQYALQIESDSKTSHNSKSYTSSISDAIDFQESIILRRQQLNRVAEWVQNNTQQLEQQQAQQAQRVQQQQQQEAHNSSTNQCDSTGGTDQQSTFSTLDQLDSVSIEKLSMDSGYKTTPQPHTNGYHQPTLHDANKSTEDSLSPKTDTSSSLNNNTNANNNNSNSYKNSTAYDQYEQQCITKTNVMQVCPTNTTYFRRTTRSGLPVAYTTPDPNNTNTCNAELSALANNYNNSNINTSTCSSTTPTLPEPPTCDILNYKYYPSETDKTHAISAELHTTTQHVDIAQMEYNVKQFLLKQNEWSMRASAASSCRGRSGFRATASSNLSSANSQMTVSSQRARLGTAKTLRHLKLFSGVGVGPGLGARVQTLGVKNEGMPAARTEREVKMKTSISRGADGVLAVAVGANAMPQRTETNL